MKIKFKSYAGAKQKEITMYKFRRSIVIYFVFIFGMILGRINEGLIFIFGIPLLLILIMMWDEVSYKKNKPSSAGTLKGKR